MKLQLLIPVKQTVTVTESFQGWHGHIVGRKALSCVLFASLSLHFLLLFQTFAVNKASFSISLHRPYGLILATSPHSDPNLRYSVASA